MPSWAPPTNPPRLWRNSEKFHSHALKGAWLSLYVDSKILYNIFHNIGGFYEKSTSIRR